MLNNNGANIEPCGILRSPISIGGTYVSSLLF